MPKLKPNNFNVASKSVLSQKEVTNIKAKCLNCGEEKNQKTGFYKSNSIILKKNNERMVICRDCVQQIYSELVDEYNDCKFALYLLCRLLDVYFDSDLYTTVEQLVTNSDGSIVGIYMQKVNSLPQYSSKTFNDSKSLNENNEENIKTSLKIELTEDDLKSEEDCIRLLGYDPFLGYGVLDQKYLYNELIPYLDEDTLEDPFKIGVVIQIVINNNQIRKANMSINNLSSDNQSMVKNSKDIIALTDMTTKWNQQNDRLSKENNIALKHRGGSGSKNSTLGSLMKNLRELGFEKAEHNYYDMKKAYGMKFSADISHQSIIDIIHFDDNDKNIVFKNQREELQKLQEKELDYREEIRKLITENSKLKDKLDTI